MGNTNFLVDRSQNDLPDKAKSLHRHGCPLRHHDDVSKGWKAPYTLCLAGGLPFQETVCDWFERYKEKGKRVALNDSSRDNQLKPLYQSRRYERRSNDSLYNSVGSLAIPQGISVHPPHLLGESHGFGCFSRRIQSRV